MFVLEERASTILFNFLKSGNYRKIFLLPANICPIVPIVFLKAKVNFEFVDIDFSDFCMNREIILDKIKDYTKYNGILFVRSYGYITNEDSFFKKIKNINNNIIIIDDRCLCLPEFNINLKYKDLVLYSTGYGKCVDIDFGGFGFIQNNIKYKKNILDFNPQDLKKITDDYKDCIKQNKKFIYSDLNWLKSSIVKINKDDYIDKINLEKEKIIMHKKKINRIYSEIIPKNIKVSDKFNLWRFNILVKDSNEILKKIFEHNLFASKHYSSLGKIFSNKKYSNSEKVSEQVINLFNDKYMNASKATSIANIVKDLTK